MDPRIHLKNYVIIADTQKALANLQVNEDLFEVTKKKIKYLMEHKYQVESRVDQSLKPLYEQELSMYHQVFEQIDKQCKQKPIEVVTQNPNVYDNYFLLNNDNKIPAINKLSGFKSQKENMIPHYKMLYVQSVLNNDHIKQAEFIIAYTKELFWVMQSFITNFINTPDMYVTSKYNSNKIKI